VYIVLPVVYWDTSPPRRSSAGPCRVILPTYLPVTNSVVSPQKAKDGNKVAMYTAENLFITPSVSLTRGGLLLVAFLSGGDYHQVRLAYFHFHFFYIDNECRVFLAVVLLPPMQLPVVI
jgi:hypothetical protein